jgi:hypothetical protein
MQVVWMFIFPARIVMASLAAFSPVAAQQYSAEMAFLVQVAVGSYAMMQWFSHIQIPLLTAILSGWINHMLPN